MGKISSSRPCRCSSGCARRGQEQQEKQQEEQLQEQLQDHVALDSETAERVLRTRHGTRGKDGSGLPKVESRHCVFAFLNSHG